MTRRRVVHQLLTIAATALVLTGCGGPLTDDELERGIQSLGAGAAEGRLVALDAAENRTKTTFVRVEARDLGDAAEHEAEKLSDARTRAGNAAIAAQAAKLAQEISGQLGDLQVAPADRDVALRVAKRLDALSNRADALVAKL
jgi:hypothetical protein